MSSHDSKFVMWLRKHKIVLLHVQTLPVVFAAVQAYLHIFILHIPQYRCQVTNDSTAIQESSKYMGGQSVPIYSSISEGKEHSSCNIYYRHLSYTTPNLEKEDDSVYHYECRQWIYNKSYFDNTFAMQENLVCRKMLFRTHAIGAFMVGFTIGSLVLGLISDSKGRKMAFLLSSALHFFSTTFLTWITDFWIFLFFRFLVGASVGGLLGTTYVMNIELVDKRWRVRAAVIYMLFWGFGALLLVMMAYVLREWKHLNIFFAAPTALFLTYYWLLPESEVWENVYYNERSKEIIEENIALTPAGNACVSPSETTNPSPSETTNPSISETTKRSPGTHKNMNIAPCMSENSRIVFVLNSFIICLNWFVVSSVFHGLSLNVSNVTGNIYINFALISAAEIGGYLLCFPLLAYWGRKCVYILSLLTGGIALILSIFTILYGTQDQLFTNILSFIGKFGTSSAFTTIFLYSAEFFHTPIRHTGFGVADFSARLGGIATPYIVDSGVLIGGDIGRVFHMVMYGISAVVASLLMLMLPETKRNPELPNTMLKTKPNHEAHLESK